MLMHREIARVVANEHVQRHAPLPESSDHEGLLARVRERLARLPARERRAYRPARTTN
jgi:hypothetical protein